MLSLRSIYFLPWKAFHYITSVLVSSFIVFIYCSFLSKQNVEMWNLLSYRVWFNSLRNPEWPYWCSAIHSWSFNCAFFLPAVFSLVYRKELVRSYAAGCRDVLTSSTRTLLISSYIYWYVSFLDFGFQSLSLSLVCTVSCCWFLFNFCQKPILLPKDC